MKKQLKQEVIKQAKIKRPAGKPCQHFWWPKESYRPTFTTQEIVEYVYCMHCLKVRKLI